ncbi:MAG: 5'-nucleotidase C-terminal domain-containing protein, partial [Oscillospiraceae bacterium]
VEGIRGVQKTTVVTMENGLRVGLTGIITPFVTQFETPENMAGITVTDAFAAAWQALSELRRKQVDLTICIYHGGFEADVKTGKILSQTGENQGWRICRELGFDVLLAAHQHMEAENLQIGGTYTCQPPEKAAKFIRMNITADRGSVHAVSRLVPAGDQPLPAAMEAIAPTEKQLNEWLDTPVGRLDTPLPGGAPLALAANGSLLAIFFNQVQLAVSGADISVTSLSNQVSDFPQNVTIRAIICAYAFPNTLKTIRVTRKVLMSALERSMAYFDFAPDGSLCVSRAFLEPIVQHFNYDTLQIFRLADLKQPAGALYRSSIGSELENRELTLCLNNYRASGGHYEAYKACPLLAEQPTEISELIMQYVEREREITVDKTQWLHLIHA